MSNTSQTNRRASLSFMTLDPFVERNIVLPVEKKGRQDVVEWGDGNRYPDFLLDLYNTVPTLRSIINGNIDFITGDEVTIQPQNGRFSDGMMNASGDSIREQVRDIAKDFEIYGGFALQVIRDLTGAVAEIHHLDLRFLRTNEDCNVFYYSEKWGKGGRDMIVYPAFMPDLDWARLDEDARNRHASSVLFVKNVRTQVYPAPLYAASVKACEIERCIDDFHLNALDNQFVSSAIVNFNNGIPTDEEKEEIENDFNEKFSGSRNAGRMIFSWKKTKDTATDIVEFKVEDFGERYKSLATHSRTQIFTAFRAIPLLFGLTSEANTGFSTDEFEQSFKLYNRTQIRPVQRLIGDAYDKIFGTSGVLSITPFSIDGNAEQIVR